MLKEIKLFYKHLYSSRVDINQNDPFFFYDTLKLNEHDKGICEGNLTKRNEIE